MEFLRSFLRHHFAGNSLRKCLENSLENLYVDQYCRDLMLTPGNTEERMIAPKNTSQESVAQL